MTRRLYYDDGYTLEFEAELTAILPLEDGRSGLVLDATYFYPTSGGQLFDRGHLGGLPVVDVREEDGHVVHVVQGAAAALDCGARVQGRIDGERRAHHRQQHSGQHLLSRVLEDHRDWVTLSSRLGETMNSLEVAAAAVSPAELSDLEDRTNQLIAGAHPVAVRYLDAEAARSAGLRKKVRRDGLVRIIEFADVESCACGGTHVRNSAEVGVVALLGTEKIRGGTRIHFLCGQRAIAWRRERVQWLERAALQLSTGAEQVEDSVTRLLDESRSARRRVEVMARELVRARATTWGRAAEQIAGVSVVLRVLDADEGLAAAEAVHAITQDPGLVAICVVGEQSRCQVLVGRGVSVEVDCGALVAAVLQKVGGKGGGKPDFARGGVVGIGPAALLEEFRQQLGSETDH